MLIDKITAREHHTNFNNLARKEKISPLLLRNTLNIKSLQIFICVVRSSHGSMNKQSKKDWTVKKNNNHSFLSFQVFACDLRWCCRPSSSWEAALSLWRFIFSRVGGEFLACKNSILSSPLSAWDVSPGENSEPQRQKFHTDDVKSVLNLVRSSDWSTW